jgi:hypothetical protein
MNRSAEGTLIAAPVLPSLRQEHDVGWDAHLPIRGNPFYFQFKLSDYMFRNNASFIRNGQYAQPYYRVALHRNDGNKQHRLLRAHSSVNPDTYYVAPEVNAYQNFENAYLSKQLTERSGLIKLSSCEDINDALQHYITFAQDDPMWIEHSEPKYHETDSVQGRDLVDLYRKATDSGQRTIDRSLFEEIYTNTRDIVTSSLKGERCRKGKSSAFD